jgi:WD40 repeat protein
MYSLEEPTLVFWTFSGHEHWVRSLALDWERRRLASAGNDMTVRLWNIDNRTEIRRYVGQTRAVAVGINSKMVVAAFHNQAVKGFKIEDELAPPIEFSGHTSWVNAVSLTETLLATGSDDRTTRIYDVETFECLNTLRGHSWAVTTVAICPSNTRVLTGSNDGTAIYWSISDAAPLLRIQSRVAAVRSVAFLRTSDEVCVCSWDGSIKIFDLKTLDQARIQALCYASIPRLTTGSLLRRIVHRDILARVRSFIIKTPPRGPIW